MNNNQNRRNNSSARVTTRAEKVNYDAQTQPFATYFNASAYADPSLKNEFDTAYAKDKRLFTKANIAGMFKRYKALIYLGLGFIIFILLFCFFVR